MSEEDETIDELRARVARLESLVLLLCQGKGHDLSWLSFYYSKYFTPTKHEIHRLQQYVNAWKAREDGEKATEPPGYCGWNRSDDD